MNLKIITSTTRDVSLGIKVADWMYNFVRENSDFEVELLDLKKINLPFTNEPNHPSLGKYQYEHTKEWSARISAADAFIIVLGEYNFGFPAPIKNAIDYLFHEWHNKPVAFVSYGGISAGLRSTQMLKQVLSALNMMPLTAQVNIPFFAKHFDAEKIFLPDEKIESSAKNVLLELHKWSETLKQLRENN